LGIRAHDFKVHRGDGFNTVVTGHLLAGEGTTRILTLTRRTVRTVRHRHTVGRAKTTEVPALHGAGKTLTDGRALNVNLLTNQEVLSGKLRTHIHQIVSRHAELGQNRLGLNLSL